MRTVFDRDVGGVGLDAADCCVMERLALRGDVLDHLCCSVLGILRGVYVQLLRGVAFAGEHVTYRSPDGTGAEHRQYECCFHGRIPRCANLRNYSTALARCCRERLCIR